MGREGPRVSCGNKALGRQIFIVGLLQLVERQHFHAELGRELQQWEGNSKGGCLWVASQHLYSTFGESFWGRVSKLSTNFEEILSRAHGDFEEQSKVLESSIIIINYNVFIIIKAY